MADVSFLLTAQIQKNLQDKQNEKRKQAAQEIERAVRDYAAAGNTVEVQRIVKILAEDYAMSSNVNQRLGGLTAIGAVAVALGKEAQPYFPIFFKTTIPPLFDQDYRVRYFACESLYNIAKVARSATLSFFGDLFDALSKLIADTDQNVRKGAELLDRLVKDIVIADPTHFDMRAFVPQLRERIYARHASARQFILNWIVALHDIPDLDILECLPDFLDGLFCILNESNAEIRRTCEVVLSRLLSDIVAHASTVNFAKMINIVVVHCGEEVGGVVTDDCVRETALRWLKNFVLLAGQTTLPFLSSILNALLPTVSLGDEHALLHDEAMAINAALINLVTRELDRDTNSPSDHQLLVKTATTSSSDSLAQSSANDETVAGEQPPSTNASLQTASCSDLDLESTADVLVRFAVHEAVQTRLTTLRWFDALLDKIPRRTFRIVDARVFPVLVNALCDSYNEIVLTAIVVLCSVVRTASSLESDNASSKSVETDTAALLEGGTNLSGQTYFIRLMRELLALFKRDKHVRQERASLIIRQVVTQLDAVVVYRVFADLLLRDTAAARDSGSMNSDELQFARSMVNILSLTLLSSAELYDMRSKLHQLATDDSRDLFVRLFKTWSHSPVAAIALCLLTQQYRFAFELVHSVGKLEVTVELLADLDRLVNLIESPIFTYLRLQLLEADANSYYLLKTLYGILMLLPQSDTFHLLRARLECVPAKHAEIPRLQNQLTDTNASGLKERESLLQHFHSLQEEHQRERIRRQLEHLRTGKWQLNKMNSSGSPT